MVITFVFLISGIFIGKYVFLDKDIANNDNTIADFNDNQNNENVNNSDDDENLDNND